jgi:sterol desaturase/sphingolipid hydroxylase (fatty acid hydroxylase superfamily)
MFDAVVQAFSTLQQSLFEALIQPALFHLGMGNLLEDGFAGTGWLLLGVLQVIIIVTVLRALEVWRPVEPVKDRAAVRTDVVYSLIHRLGLFKLAMFFSVDDWAFKAEGLLRLQGWHPWQPDQIWPGVTDQPWTSLLIYLVIFDFVDYAIHRGQHRWHRWWALHALHHSQRQMTRWSDNRNHLLDDVIRDGLMVAVALVLGVGPGQFVAIVVVTQLVESLSHANVRLSFGPVLGRLLVSPAYHRQHHAIGIGHESAAGRGTLGGCNFAVLFPVWDLLFRTASFDFRYEATGIRDQLPQEGGRDYGRGFWQQQWLGLKRLAGVA